MNDHHIQYTQFAYTCIDVIFHMRFGNIDAMSRGKRLQFGLDRAERRYIARKKNGLYSCAVKQWWVELKKSLCFFLGCKPKTKWSYI